MKKLAFIILILFSVSAKAQTSVYHPFPESNATWCCSGNALTPPDCFRNWTTYQLNGQTQINSFLYNRLLHYTFTIHYTTFNGFPCYESDTTIDTTSFYIRQDSGLKTIWYYDSQSQSDKVLYNFNLNVGDTLNGSKIFWGAVLNNKVITSVDSVLLGGNYRKRFNYGTGCFTNSTDTSMIEGIGSLHGLLFPPSCFEYAYYLNAFTQDNIVLIGDTTGACHDFTTGYSETNKRDLISLFPNPFHLSATLQLNSDFQNSEINIYNVFGEKVKQDKLLTQATFIYRNNLSNGIYFYRVINSKGESLIGKFIIE